MNNELFDEDDEILPGKIKYKYLISVIDEFQKNKLIAEPAFDSSSIKLIQNICKTILDKIRAGTHENVMDLLNSLIEFINSSNSVTLIGTLEFMDMISKYGSNRVTCQVSGTIQDFFIIPPPKPGK